MGITWGLYGDDGNSYADRRGKVAGRHTGTSLLIVKATDRQGNAGSVTVNQRLKMFLAPWHYESNER